MILDANVPDQQIQNACKLLIARARKRHGKIIPCDSWDRSFTIENNTVFFWYTTPRDQSTHLVFEELRTG